MVKMLRSQLQQAGARVKVASLTVSETKRTRGRAWMDKRERILRRDCGLCRCSECTSTGRIRIATEVDHKVPLWKGGTDDDDNLQAINADCHLAKTSAEASERGGRGG